MEAPGWSARTTISLRCYHSSATLRAAPFMIVARPDLSEPSARRGNLVFVKLGDPARPLLTIAPPLRSAVQKGRQ